jgi:hypothetical protein
MIIPVKIAVTRQPGGFTPSYDIIMMAMFCLGLEKV